MGAVLGSLCVDRHIAAKWSNVLLTADDCLTIPNPTEERSPRPQVVVWSTCTRRNLAPSQNAVTPRRPCSVSNQLAHGSCHQCASVRSTLPEPTVVSSALPPSEAELSALSWSKNKRSLSKY